MYHDYSLEKIIDHLKTSKKKKFILDTDTYNDIDDQFAITYAMILDDIDVLAMSASPFNNSHASDTKDSQEKSYDELVRVRDLVDPESKLGIPCYRGSESYMKNMITPVVSEAAENIVRIVNETDDIVYIGVIGCFTNIASALLLDPSIADKVVIVLLGGSSLRCHGCGDFNLHQDVNAARVIFECGVPVALLPAIGDECTDAIYMTNAEVSFYLKDKAGRIGNYLCDIFNKEECSPEKDDGSCESRQRSIFDIGAVEFVHNPDSFQYEIVPTRTSTPECSWREIKDGRNMIYAKYADRNRIVSNFFTTIRKAKLK